MQQYLIIKSPSFLVTLLDVQHLKLKRQQQYKLHLQKMEISCLKLQQIDENAWNIIGHRI